MSDEAMAAFISQGTAAILQCAATRSVTRHELHWVHPTFSGAINDCEREYLELVGRWTEKRK